MPNVTSSFFKTQTTFTPTSFSTIEILNETTSVTANTETSIALPSNTRAFKIKLRRGNTGPVKYTFTSGESGTIYEELSGSSAHFYSDLSSAVSWTLYVQSPKTSQILEIVTMR